MKQLRSLIPANQKFSSMTISDMSGNSTCLYVYRKLYRFNDIDGNNLISDNYRSLTL